MTHIKIEASVGNSEFTYNWEQAYTHMGSTDDEQAKLTLTQLDIAYKRVRASILVGMKPDEKVVEDDRPEIEKRTVESGPIKVKPVLRGDGTVIVPNAGPYS